MKRDESKLTAYALGELSVEEASIVEKWLADDPELAAEVDQVRETAALLEEGFKGEDASDGLTSGQLVAIKTATRQRGRSTTASNWAAVATAAGVLLAVAFWAMGDGGEATDELTYVSDGRMTVPSRVAKLQGLGYGGGESSGTTPASGEPAASDARYISRSGTAGIETLDLNGLQNEDGDGDVRARVEDLYTREAVSADELHALASLGYAVSDEEQTVTSSRPNRERAPSRSSRRGEDSPSYRAFSLGEERTGSSRWYRDEVPAAGTEDYQRLVENTFQDPRTQPLSTFSVDVDTASYANIRRFLTEGRLPPPSAVRVEEMINYFRYDYRQPEGEHPFAVDVEVGACPWNRTHRLLRVGLQGKLPIDRERKRANLVFLLDVSGSMSSANKLPLVKDSLRLLVRGLTEDDTVAIVTYAGRSGVHLRRTHGEDRGALLAAINTLNAGGSTNGESGLNLAYRLATEGFIEGGINRVMLATDGDFNVGQSSDEAMKQLIVRKARSGVHLTVLGFGTGNLKDSKLEVMSGNGDGNYAYIDSLREAKRVLVDELAGTLETIAKDVKFQLDFNPSQVAAYRLVGYENRALAARDFTDDTKDAGEIGAGHRVTALYEIVPAGVRHTGVEPSKYTEPAPRPEPVSGSPELCEVRLRYKQPDGGASREFRVPVTDRELEFAECSEETRFAASVAAFGMILQGSPHRGTATADAVAGWARDSMGDDEGGYRAEFHDLVRRAMELGLR